MPKFRKEHKLDLNSAELLRRQNEIPDINENTAVILYRSARELLINAVKHSRASTVVMRLAIDKDDLALIVMDDGVGCDLNASSLNDAKAQTGFGLISIKEKILSLRGTFTIDDVRGLVDQACDVVSVKTICFEGGEPLLFLPTLLAGLRYAKRRGFETGVVTNAYQARSPADASVLLDLLKDAGLDALTISDDVLHYGSLETTPAQYLMDATENAGFPAHVLSVELPGPESPTGSVMFRGRAADAMVDGVPRKPWGTFTECPHENPLKPGRVHIDCYGNIHFCQGIVIGNVWKESLSSIVASLNLTEHPVCGPLAAGGPAELARRLDAGTEEKYVDACHLCFETRRQSLEKLPEVLTPPQVYGR